jgi:hypothetical protein
MSVIDMRRALVLLTILAALSGCGTRFPGPSSPLPAVPAPGATAASPTPVLITVPDVVGQNAAVAADKLKKAGFTNVGFGTVDGRPAVLVPENWTVRAQSAQPGEHLAADAKIVLGCARNG